MLTERQKKICEKYSARDKDNKVHCLECPLNRTIVWDIKCNATHHYDRQKGEWVRDEPDIERD